MTQKENQEYYINWLKQFFTEKDVDILLKEHPINTTVVQSINKKEGYISKDKWWGDVLLLYLAQEKTAYGSGWVGISAKKHSIVTIPTKYIELKRKLNNAEIKNFIFLHYYNNNDDKGNYCDSGERLINEALIKMGYHHAFSIVKEYEIPSLVNFENYWVKPPRFDFAILDKKTKQPLMFLEFDGAQHYAATEEYPDFWQGYCRDNAKNGYAFYSCVPLIRIPYGILAENNNIDKVIQIIQAFLKTISRATPKTKEP